MTTEVTFRHFNGQHPNLHDAALESAEKFKKFNNQIISTHIEFINEKSDKTVQFTVNAKGTILVAKDSSDDFQKSIALAEDKLIRQLRKLKTKILNHQQ